MTEEKKQLKQQLSCADVFGGIGAKMDKKKPVHEIFVRPHPMKDKDLFKSIGMMLMKEVANPTDYGFDLDNLWKNSKNPEVIKWKEQKNSKGISLLETFPEPFVKRRAYLVTIDLQNAVTGKTWRTFQNDDTRTLKFYRPSDELLKRSETEPDFQYKETDDFSMLGSICLFEMKEDQPVWIDCNFYMPFLVANTLFNEIDSILPDYGAVTNFRAIVLSKQKPTIRENKEKTQRKTSLVMDEYWLFPGN